MTGYSNYTRAKLRSEFVEVLRRLNVMEDIMKNANESVVRLDRLDTIRRKTLKLMGRLLDGLE